MVLKLECLRSTHPKSRRSKLTDQLTSNLYILEESLRELKAGGDQTTRQEENVLTYTMVSKLTYPIMIATSIAGMFLSVFVAGFHPG